MCRIEALRYFTRKIRNHVWRIGREISYIHKHPMSDSADHRYISSFKTGNMIVPQFNYVRFEFVSDFYLSLEINT